jgi:hypothetical protein
MDIAIGEEPDKMNGPPFPAPRDDVLPQSGLENLSTPYGLVDQPSSLVEHSACPQGIVSHLAVSHVLVRRQPYRCPVSLERAVESGHAETVKVGGPGQVHGVCFILWPNPDSVHDDEKERAVPAGKRREFVEFQVHRD